jgi:hypothetical protein
MTKGGATWNWGATQWVDVTIISNMIDTSWCKTYVSLALCVLQVISLLMMIRYQVEGTNSTRVNVKSLGSEVNSSTCIVDIVELTTP